MKKSIALLVAVVALLVVALPMVSAQEATPEATATLTFTEGEINNAFWITNPVNRNLTNVNVDLQSDNGGQVTLSATYTWRTRSGVKSSDVVTVIAPRLSNDRLFWDVISITANGKPASQDIINQVNYHIMAAWRNWAKEHAPAGRLTGVTITDDDITFAYIPRL